MLSNENTNSFDNHSIASSLQINNYLNNPIINCSYYIKNYDRIKQFELDLVLINEKAVKYNWDKFLNKKITINYPFEKGLDLQISINQELPKKDKNDYEGTIVSTNYPLAYSNKINDKNQILFKNIFVRDSTELLFNLTKGNTAFDKPIRLFSNIISNKKKFLKLKSMDIS